MQLTNQLGSCHNLQTTANIPNHYQAYAPVTNLSQHASCALHVNSGFCQYLTILTTVVGAVAGNTTFSRRLLRAELHVSSPAPLLPGVRVPELVGQVEASADDNGQISITDVRLTAAPGTYLVNISLPDYPDVSTVKYCP